MNPDMNPDTNDTENAGIVEPYELPVDTTKVVESVEATGVSEVDLSGYQYDIVPTYKMIEDCDDQDTLFRIQFLQAFGITDDEYHPEIVSAIINDLYERYIRNPDIRDIVESHPLYNGPSVVESSAASSSSAAAESDVDENDADSGETTTTVPLSPSPIGHRSFSTPEGDNSEMIFCMMFSFQLFDLFHKCLRHAKHGESIPQSLRDEITESLRRQF
jgi:hypothetical protein